MPTSTQSELLYRLTENFGNPTDWKSKTGANCALWTTNLPFEIVYPHDGGNDVHIRRTLEDRRHLRTVPVVLLADSDDPTKMRVVGPHEPYVVRQLNSTSVLNLIERARQLSTRPAVAFLEREFRRLDESVLPGIRVKELLTPHYIRTRLRQYSSNKDYLEAATQNIKRITQTASWRTLFSQLGYQIDRLEPRGHLLRYQNSPVAVVHPMSSADEFNHMNQNGELPDGLVLKDCQTNGAHWGILAADLRFRIFQVNPNFGSATARYIEIDARELDAQDRLYLGLIAPESLKANGRLTAWASDARDFGEELRKGLEERLRTIALPNLAKGIGRHLELTEGVDLKDRENLREIEEAVLTLVFRFMFLLHVEARGYLPVNSDDYTSRSARRIAEESRKEQWEYDPKSTRLSDSIRTLTRMIRHGDGQVGVPAYNGSLFAADRFPGAEMLENIEVADNYVAPAIRAITFDPDQSDAGLDYAGLQIGHLGAIYEALLALKLTRANEDLKYDPKRDVFRPMRVGETAEIIASELFYQTEKGGRKAGGVYYTREEFVQHLLRNSLVPALDEHLERIEKLSKTDPKTAARNLFDFSIVDPAMGSGHFLTTALDMVSDRIELFLADIGGLPGIRSQLEELKKGEDEDLATIEDVDLLRRLILKRCIYGVDISPMAVEVANVTLWLASFVPGLALSYLGSNLKCGDALIGVADPKVVGSSDSPLFTGKNVGDAMKRAAKLQRDISETSDITPDEVKRSQERHDKMNIATAGLRRAFDLWTAEPLGVNGARHELETSARTILNGEDQLDGKLMDLMDQSNRLANQYRFFHWPLEFPHVYHRDRPGFNVVTGNPPWNEVTVEELRFYLLRDPGLRGVQNLTDRRRRIEEFDLQHPELRAEFDSERRSLERIRRFFNSSGGYSLQGVGDKDLYQLFCERYTHLIRKNGRLGVVLPRAAFATQGASQFREWLFERNNVRRLDTILNNRRWAFPIHGQFSIALLTAQLKGIQSQSKIELSGPSSNLVEFMDVTGRNGVEIPPSALGRPYVLPLIPTQDHANILAKMRRGVRFDNIGMSNLGRGRENTAVEFRVIPHRELDETQQRRFFTLPDGQGDTPVWKGRSFGQYDPHGVDYAGLCAWDETFEFIQKKSIRSSVFKNMFDRKTLEDPTTHPVNRCRVAFRHITNRTNSRTFIACLVPPKTPLTNAAPYLIFPLWATEFQAPILGILDSLSFDWIARRYVELNMNYFILNMLTFPPPDNTPWQQIGKLAARLSCVDERFADFAAETGVEYGPQTDAERDDMRAKIDALVARAYDLTADELSFVFTDFTERAVTPAYRQLVLGKFERL